ncbi:MAG: helix-turn-helix domain-containing protein [Candidatus Accumulibacter sp.]|nr:helix-turn-helix domain-containing protein [Accumulibacter sp.]MCM8600061.1 helix-turn-helix domain-containing protein [Accumulibacter sp.]
MVSDYFKTPTDTEQAVSVSALLESAAADLLDEQAAARLLDNSPGTLSVWRSTGRYNLPFIKVGRNVRYRRADLIAWLEKRTRDTGATA